MVLKRDSWEGKSGDGLYEYFMDLEMDDQVSALREMMADYRGEDPDLWELLNEISRDLIYAKKADLLEELIDELEKIFSGSYRKEFSYFEADLISYYLFRKNLPGVLERLKYPIRYPAEGADNVTIPVLYQLIWYGHCEAALNLSNAVWETMRDSTELIGPSHHPFIIAIYLDVLEKEYERIRGGGKADWARFMKGVEEYGFEPDQRMEQLMEMAFGKPYSREDALVFFEMGEPLDLVRWLNLYFLQVMKEEYGIPFMLSDQWWNMLASKSLFGKRKDPASFFMFEYQRLDAHFAEHYDDFLGSNRIQMFGRAHGLKYAYHFLNRCGLIEEKDYEQMKVRISALEYMFERLAGNELWKMTFVFQWPVIEDHSPGDSGDQGTLDLTFEPVEDERPLLYEATFTNFEDDYEEELDEYFVRRLLTFPPKIRKHLSYRFPSFGDEAFPFD